MVSDDSSCLLHHNSNFSERWSFKHFIANPWNQMVRPNLLLRVQNALSGRTKTTLNTLLKQLYFQNTLPKEWEAASLNNFKSPYLLSSTPGRSSGSVMSKVLDSSFKVTNSKSGRAITFTFGLILVGKLWTPYFPSYSVNSITTVLLQGWLWH